MEGPFSEPYQGLESFSQGRAGPDDNVAFNEVSAQDNFCSACPQSRSRGQHGLAMSEGVLSKDALLKEIEQLLSDFLLDLECAKEDGALTGFSEYSSCEKKWWKSSLITSRNMYNTRRIEKWPFQPLFVFPEFVKESAKIKTRLSVSNI